MVALAVVAWTAKGGTARLRGRAGGAYAGLLLGDYFEV